MNTQIEWYELHDELPQVASVIKKYSEIMGTLVPVV